MKKLFLMFLTFTGFYTSNYAQNMSELCGTTDWNSITERLIENRRFMEAGHYNIDRSVVKYVPVKFHLIAKKDGSNRLPETKVFENLCQLNIDYADQNMVFYMADGTMNYINDNNAYTNQANTLGSAALKAARSKNAINIFFAAETPSPSSTLGGIVLGYYSPMNDWLVIRNDQVNRTSGTLSHELGHCFSLKHPFSGWDQKSFLQWYAEKFSKTENWGNVPVWFKLSVVDNLAPNGSSKIECFDGSNCATSGDLVCDTPADYNFGFNWDKCSPFTRKLVGPCDRDSIKDTMEDNFMAYFIGCAKYKFTAEQKALIQADYYSSRRAYIRSNYVPSIQMNAQHATNHVPLSGPVQFYDNVKLDWDDIPDADAYILEVDRSSSFNSASLSRYYVGSSSHTVFNLEAGKSYFWRVLPCDLEGGTCLSISDAIKAKFSTSAFTSGTSEIASLNQWSISPNPVKSGSRICVKMNVETGFDATIALYNSIGQEVRTIASQQFAEGDAQISIETSGISSGMYYIRLQSENGLESKRLIIAD